MLSWVGRFVRARRLDRNPLRRASDRVETALLAALVIAFAAAVPFAVGACGAWTRAVSERVQAEQRATRQEVTAVLLEGASDRVTEGDVFLQEPARWTAPDGTRVTGQVEVPAGTAAGATVRVWVTRDGQVTGAPLLDSEVSGNVALAEVGAGAGLAVVLLLAGWLARRALDTRRMRAWEAEWRAAGPRWTTRA